MTSAATNPLVQRYLQQLAAGLAVHGVPAAEHAAILGEIESHIAEATESGKRLADILERLGDAHELARAYAVESLLRPRVEGGEGRLRSLSRRALRSTTLAAAGVLVSLLGGCGALLLVGGALGVVAGVVAPLLPFDPNLRAGLPQLVVILLSLGCAAAGAALVRLLRWNLGLLRRPHHPKETTR